MYLSPSISLLLQHLNEQNRHSYLLEPISYFLLDSLMHEELSVMVVELFLDVLFDDL